MAGPNDPFTPGPTSDPTAGIGDFDLVRNLRSQWETFMQQPGAMAGLLQAGISLMQPPSFGDTPTSQIGRAIGAGAEAVGRGQTEEAKTQLLEARGEVARARVGEAGQRLGLEHFRQQALSQRQADALALQAHKLYSAELARYAKEVDAWQKANAASELSGVPNAMPQPQHPGDFDTWIRARGLALPAQTSTASVGTVMTGRGGKRYRFKGGDQRDPANWEPVGGAAMPSEGGE